MAVIDNALPVRVLAMSPGNPEPPKAIPLRLDFAADTLYTTNFETQRQQTKFQSLRAIYYNAINCANDVSVYFPDTQQRMMLLAGKQGYREVLADQTMRLEITGVAPDVCIIHLLNVDVPSYDWPQDAAVGAVSSVFGRVGAVVAANGDYTASQVTNVPAGNIAAVTVQTALNELDSEKVAKAGDTMTGPLSIVVATGVTPGAAALTLQSNDAANTGPSIITYHNTASPAANDTLGIWRMFGKDSVGNDRAYGFISGQILDPTTASEDLRINFAAIINGVLAVRMRMGDGLYFGALTDQGANTINAGAFYTNSALAIDTDNTHFIASFTFGTLPAASANRRATITDSAAAPVFSAAAAGGGALRIPVYADGAAWRNG